MGGPVMHFQGHGRKLSLSFYAKMSVPEPRLMGLGAI